MPKKPALTPRERKTMDYVNKANKKYGEVSIEFNEVMESASIVQDLLYFRALSSDMSMTEIKKAYKDYKETVKNIDDMFAEVMGTKVDPELYADIVIKVK